MSSSLVQLEICVQTSDKTAAASKLMKLLAVLSFSPVIHSNTNRIHRCVLSFLDRRKSKARRSKSRYKMLEADEQDTLELQPPRAGKSPPTQEPCPHFHTFHRLPVDAESSDVNSLEASAVLIILSSNMLLTSSSS